MRAVGLSSTDRAGLFQSKSCRPFKYRERGDGLKVTAVGLSSIDSPGIH